MNILKLLAPVLMAGILVACGAPLTSQTNGSSASGETPGMTAFKTGFYQFAATAKCNSCHATTISPKFASLNVQEAYNSAKSRLNLDDPTNSLLATYTANGHCGTTSCSDATKLPTVRDLLTAWATAEKTPSPGGPSGPVTTVKYFTSEVAVGAVPTSTQNPKALRFQLSSLNPAVAALNGAVLEIEIKDANVSTYSINRIKIAGNTAAVAVKGVHVYVKPSGSAGAGVEDSNQGMGWTSLNVTAASSGLPNPLPNGPMTTVQPLSTMAIQVEKQSTSDVLVIGFESLN